MILKILLLSSVVLLTGCASIFGPSVKQIETVKVEVSKPALNLPNPEPLKLRETKWVVVTKENADKIFEELEAKGQPVALFALTADGYEALSINIADIKTFIGTQKEIIIQYREYYEGEEDDEKQK
tara:strand:+ start:4821 stop:5198 length:378 start_codon:yes stop_codon:yes gene_type:complete